MLTHTEIIIKDLALRILEMDLDTHAALGMAAEVAEEIQRVCKTETEREYLHPFFSALCASVLRNS